MTTPANTKDVLIAGVIDRSGSMNRHRQATLDGFNEFLDEQRAQEGEAFLSLTFFDTSFETRYVGTPLSDVPPLGSPSNPYIPNGMTALCDAVGVCIKGTEAWLANHPEFNGQVMVVVQTDGGENSSKEWHIKQPMVDGDPKDVAGLIRWKQAEGWQFLFLGAGGSDWLERNFGHVAAKGTIYGFNNDAKGYQTAFRGVSASMTRSRMTGAAFVAPQDEKAEDLAKV